MGLFAWLRGDTNKPAEPETLASPAPTKEDIEQALAKAERMVLDGHAPTPVLARVLRITTAVKARMVENRDVDASAISVETLNGTVQLSGFAKSGTEKATAERIARGVKGVKSVQNAIVVRG